MDENQPAVENGPSSAPASDPAPMPESTPGSTPEHASLPTRVDIRSASLAVLAVLGTVFALHWASALLIPLTLGLTLSYALSPVVDRLERLRLPRALGAALLMIAITGGVGWTAYALSDDASEFIDSLPEAMQKIRQAVRAQRGHSETTIDKVQRAATHLEQAAKEGAPVAPPAQGVTRVRVERQPFDIKDYLWTGTLGLVVSVGQGAVVLCLTFFLLTSGNTFRRKMVKIAGPTFTQRRITVQALDEITNQIQRYLLVQVLVSILVGLVTWLIFLAIGLEHAAVWGVCAFALNFIPYIGSIVLTVLSALVGFVQFGSIDMSLLLAGVSLVVHTISGHLLMPWLTSRANEMNAVVVFAGVLAFGWLWGVWGLLLGVPVLTAIKAVCDRVENLKPVGELLGK
ncbi:MAG TPA: AI-2E family transporter [Burkholderiaceae bacterium]|nr:AI-2E family transporter [Burkholderiaceae bacterium]